METVSLNFITLPCHINFHSFLHSIDSRHSDFSFLLNSLDEVNREIVANSKHPWHKVSTSLFWPSPAFILNQRLHPIHPVDPQFELEDDVALLDRDGSTLQFMDHLTVIDLYKACWVYNRSIVTFINEINPGPGFLARMEEFMNYLSHFGYNSPNTHITQEA